MDNNSNNQDDLQEEFAEEQDVVSEDDNQDDLSERIKKLREKLKRCETEKREYLLGWQRLKADFVNVRKKDAEEKKDFEKFAGQNIISSLIPTLNNFHAALGDPGWEKIPEEWRQGIENAFKEFENILSQNGLEEINPETGSVFNPSLAEAVGLDTTDESEKDNRISLVFQKGYKLHEKVLYPAKVRVWEYKN